MKGYIIFSLFAIAIMACDNDDKDTLNATDKNFVEQAALGNKTESKFGELASMKGSEDMVKQFGQRMKNEHTVALADLENIAARYQGVDMSNDMDAEHQQLYTTLQSLSGSAFDSAYINSQVMDHQKTVSLFQTEVNSGTRQDVKDYAAKYLPHIQAHLTSADSIQAALQAKRKG